MILSKAAQTEAATLSTPTPATETRILLEGISWETFERLLEETGAERKQRFAYRDGLLEILVPLAGHEEPTRLFDDCVAVFVDELGLELRKLGSLTMKNPTQKKGLEPDCCFYIQNEAVVRGINSLDFTVHPPPDLVVEVDNSSPSLSKFPIYVALKIPEIWRFRGGKLTIYHLNVQQDDYEERDESCAFPKLPVQELPNFLDLAKEIGQRSAVRKLKKRVQQALTDLGKQQL